MNGTKIEEVRVVVNGIERVFDVEQFPGTTVHDRAYVRGSSQYYELPVFEKGLLNADHVERFGFLEQDKWTTG